MSVISMINTMGALAACIVPAVMGRAQPLEIDLEIPATPVVATGAIAGLWTSEDRLVRLRLQPDGRYDEARGTRRSAYRGRYEVEGQRLYFADDRGFTALGEVRNGVLRLGSERLMRQ